MPADGCCCRSIGMRRELRTFPWRLSIQLCLEVLLPKKIGTPEWDPGYRRIRADFQSLKRDRYHPPKRSRSLVRAQVTIDNWLRLTSWQSERDERLKKDLEYYCRIVSRGPCSPVALSIRTWYRHEAIYVHYRRKPTALLRLPVARSVLMLKCV
jgi:hypothetical protein